MTCIAIYLIVFSKITINNYIMILISYIHLSDLGEPVMKFTDYGRLARRYRDFLFLSWWAWDHSRILYEPFVECTWYAGEDPSGEIWSNVNILLSFMSHYRVAMVKGQNFSR